MDSQTEVSIYQLFIENLIYVNEATEPPNSSVCFYSRNASCLDTLFFPPLFFTRIPDTKKKIYSPLFHFSLQISARTSMALYHVIEPALTCFFELALLKRH